MLASISADYADKAGDEVKTELLNEAFETMRRGDDVPNAVATAWMISFDQIKRQDPCAAEMLSLMTFLDRQGIPKSLLQRQGESPLDFAKALGTLKAFSLLTETDAGNTFDIHRLVQLVTRKWLVVSGEFEKWAGGALATMASLYPNGQFENWNTCAMYLPHAQAVLRYVSKPTDLTLRLTLLSNVGWYLWGQGQWKEAEELEVQVMETRKRVLGQEHPDTLTGMNNLAYTFKSQGRHKKAVALMADVQKLRQKVLGSKHSNTMASVRTLAKW